MNSEVIYQSGQRVTVNGWYEVAGAPNAQHALHPGELFPNHDGRAVCWRLLHAEPVSEEVIDSVRQNMKPTPAELIARLRRERRNTRAG
jgi:hypothetical protein